MTLHPENENDPIWPWPDLTFFRRVNASAFFKGCKKVLLQEMLSDNGHLLRPRQGINDGRLRSSMTTPKRTRNGAVHRDHDYREVCQAHHLSWQRVLQSWHQRHPLHGSGLHERDAARGQEDENEEWQLSSTPWGGSHFRSSRIFRITWRKQQFICFSKC